MSVKTEFLNILFTEKASRYIGRKRLARPTILANLIYKSGGGGGCGGEPSPPVPHVKVMLVEGGDLGKGFEKIETAHGVPIFMAAPIFNVATHSQNPLVLSVKGIIMKRLQLDGVDLSPLLKNSQRAASCH
jgi:hypothetical protein